MHKGYEQTIHGRSTLNLSTYGNILNLLIVKIEFLKSRYFNLIYTYYIGKY